MPTTREELSDRELEILRLVATGASNKEIARRLFISTNTVKVHLRNIFAKIGVSSRTEAAMYAVNMGLVPGAIGAGPLAVEEEEEDQSVAAAQPPLPPTRTTSRILAWLLAALALVTVGLLVSVILWVRSLSPIGEPPAATTLEVGASVDEASRWQVLSAMPTARYGLGVVAYEGQIYAVGGQDASGVVGTLERYQADTETWESLPPKPLAVADVKAAAVGGRIYVPGGRLASGDMTDAMEIFDPRQISWSRGATLPARLSGYALAGFEGKLYLFGGWDGVHYLDTVYEYDPGQDAWRVMTPMPTARAYHGAAVANGKIYVIGGFDGQSALSVNEVYQPNLDIGFQGGNAGVQSPWQEAPDMPQACYGAGVTSLADYVYVVCGIGASSSQPVMPLQYQPEAQLWQAFDLPPGGPREFADLAPLGSRLYVVGGRQGGLPASQVLSYQAIYTVIFPVIRK